MKLQISHVTQYDYAEPVRDSVNEIRLSPSTNERQSCYQQTISIEPNAPLFTYEDFFGNRVHAFSVNEPHNKLIIRSQMIVVTKEALKPKELADKLCRMPPEEAWSWLRTDEAENRFIEYLLPTTYTEMTQEVLAFAESICLPRVKIDVYEWLKACSSRIRSDFIYDPEATTVQTKASDMIQQKRGVCQDFAHLMIAACRSYSIPARYVSGYHFVGDLQGGSADFVQASHAWVEAYVPALGWCSFDPTNVAPVGERYVKLGHGRDYQDIVPVKGVYQGEGNQQLHVIVDVRKMVET